MHIRKNWIDWRVFHHDRDYHDRVMVYVLRQAVRGHVQRIVVIETLKHPVEMLRLFLAEARP